MLILAIDSATPVAGVALLTEEKLLKEEFSNYKKTHSETLMVMIDRVMKECECCLDELTAIALSIGPGSFTGLRIGMATVKGLCLAKSLPLIEICTLDAIAYNIAGTRALVCPLLDARKQEVYTAFYDVEETKPRRLGQIMACSPEQFVNAALSLAREQERDRLILLGDGFYSYRDYFHKMLGEKMQAAPLHLGLPRASAVGSLAIDKALEGDYADPLKLRPLYIRLSEAEYRLGKGEL